MKKVVIMLITVCVLCSSFLACSKKEVNVDKPVTGIDPIFSEYVGYYNESPTLIEEDGARFVFYGRNTVKNDKDTASIAVRKGVKTENAYEYSHYATVLEKGKEGAWDSVDIKQPTVVKGDFVYSGKHYEYLMAYSGTDKGDRTDYQIGFAVSNSLTSKFTKVGNEPMVSYDSDDYMLDVTRTEGLVEPSFVSYDKSSKVYLFFTIYRPTAAHLGKCMELDLSGDLNQMSSKKADLCLTVTSFGIEENTTYSYIAGGDYAYVRNSDEFVVVRESLPKATEVPYTSTSVCVVRGNAYDVLYKVGKVEGWADISGAIDSFKTSSIDEEGKFDGYSRIYAGCLLKDAYGDLIVNNNKITVLITSKCTAEVENYDFTSQIHEVETSL